MPQFTHEYLAASGWCIDTIDAIDELDANRKFRELIGDRCATEIMLIEDGSTQRFRAAIDKVARGE